MAALKAAERVGGLRYHPAGKTLTGAVKGVTVDQIRPAKGCSYDWSCRKEQTVVDLKKKNAVLEEEKAELKKKILPSMRRWKRQRSVAVLKQNRQLWVKTRN